MIDRIYDTACENQSSKLACKRLLVPLFAIFPLISIFHLDFIAAVY